MLKWLPKQMKQIERSCHDDEVLRSLTNSSLSSPHITSYQSRNSQHLIATAYNSQHPWIYIYKFIPNSSWLQIKPLSTSIYTLSIFNLSIYWFLRDQAKPVTDQELIIQPLWVFKVCYQKIPSLIGKLSCLSSINFKSSIILQSIKKKQGYKIMIYEKW